MFYLLVSKIPWAIFLFVIFIINMKFLRFCYLCSQNKVIIWMMLIGKPIYLLIFYFFGVNTFMFLFSHHNYLRVYQFSGRNQIIPSIKCQYVSFFSLSLHVSPSFFSCHKLFLCPLLIMRTWKNIESLLIKKFFNVLLCSTIHYVF